MSRFIRLKTEVTPHRVRMGRTKEGKPKTKGQMLTKHYLTYARNGIKARAEILPGMIEERQRTNGARYCGCDCCEEVQARRDDGSLIWVVQPRTRKAIGPIQTAMDNLRLEIMGARRKRREVAPPRGDGYFFKLLERRRREEEERMMRSIRDPKKPVNHRKHIGVELEFVSSKGRNTIATKLVKAGLGQYCQLKGDGSVNHQTGVGCECGPKGKTCECPRREGNELAIVAGRQSIQKIVEKACKILTEECDAITNRTCGLHVHLDMRPDDIKVERAYANLVGLQSLLFAMVPKSRRTNKYCKLTTERDWARRSSDRYMGINAESFGKHGTLEVRIHSGTLSARKVNHWIELLCLIAYCEKDISRVASLTDLAHETDMPKELLAYCLERLMTFQNQHGGALFPIHRRELDAETYMETQSI